MGEKLTVSKLAARHTKVGIKVKYDDHCVMLVQAVTSKTLTVTDPDTKEEKVAVWTGSVRFAEMVAFADLWLAQGGQYEAGLQ